MYQVLLDFAYLLIGRWHGRLNQDTEPIPAQSTRMASPIVELYVRRPCPERERFNESLCSTGFVAADGILRVFYNENNLAVELEINGITIDLREVKPFPIHPKWCLAKDLVHTWMRDHDVVLGSDFAWVSNVWT